MRARVNVFTVESATVYRAGVSGRRYLSKTGALMGYAKAKFRAKHPCECEPSDYTDNYPGFNCGVHDLRDKVLPRYVRMLRRKIKSVTARRNASSS
jgi:hypothetical protein